MNDSPHGLDAIRGYSPVVFANCAAGGTHTRLQLPRVQKLFESLNVSASFVLAQSAEELESAAKAAIAKNHSFLLAMGGDGT